MSQPFLRRCFWLHPQTQRLVVAHLRGATIERRFHSGAIDVPASPAGFSFCARCNSSTSQWVIAAKSGTVSSNFLTRLKNLNHTFNFSSARPTASDASAKTVPSEHRGAHVRALSRIFMTPPNAQRSMPDCSGRVPAFVPRFAATRPRLLRDSYCSRSATPPFASLARSTALLRSPTLSYGAVLQVNRISTKPHCRSGSINIAAIQSYRHNEKANQGSGPAKVGNFRQGSPHLTGQHREDRQVTGPLPKRPPAQPIRCAPKPKKRHFYDPLD